MDLSVMWECEAAIHCATWRCEHYNSWLSSQIILNTIHANDIQVVGGSAIPNRTKQPIYHGYPQSEPSDCMDRNTTPGPSYPWEQDERQQHHENTCDDGRSQKSNVPQHDTRHTAMGNSPSDLNDSSSIDGERHIYGYEDHMGFCSRMNNSLKHSIRSSLINTWIFQVNSFAPYFIRTLESVPHLCLNLFYIMHLK